MSSIRKTPEYLRRAYNLRGEVAEAVEPVEPVGSAEPAEAAAAVAVRREELAAGARSLPYAR
jgi:predicted transcriptional regulator